MTTISTHVLVDRRGQFVLVATVFCFGIATILFGAMVPATLLGLIAVLCLIGLAAISPDKMFLFTIALMILLPVEIGTKWSVLPTIGPSLIAIVALLIGASIHFGVVNCRKPFDNIVFHIPMRRFWAAYLILSVFGAIVSINLRASFYAIGKEVFILLGLVTLLNVFLRDPTFWPRLRTTLYIVTAIVCLYALLEEATHNNLLLQFYPEEDAIFRGGILRVRSTFFHPIALGSYLCLVYPFLVTDFLHRKRIWSLTLLSLIAIAGFFTASRGPWLVALIETTVLWAALRRPGFKQIAIGLLAVATLVTSAALWGHSWNLTIGQSFLNPNNLAEGRFEEASSEYYRLAVVKAAIGRLEGLRWLYGYGPGTFYLANVESDYAGQEHVLSAGDSQYALYLVELGVVGLGIFGVMIFQVIRTCARAVRYSNANQRYLASACLAATIGFAVNAATASVFLLLPLHVLFWMCVILASPSAPFTRQEFYLDESTPGC